MLTKTYQTWVQTNPDPILNQSDETVQAAVYDWFKYRYIGFSDDEKFKDIFQRNVSLYYPMYKQKLRIEPGVSQYDWLVSTYRERQLKSTGETGNVRTHGADTATSSKTTSTDSTDTRDLKDISIRTGGTTDTKGGSDTVTGSGTDNLLKTGYQATADTGTDTHTKTGTDTTSETGTDTHAKTGTDTVTDTGTDTHTKTGTEKATQTGTDTHTKTGTDTTTTSETGSSTRTGGYTENDVSGLHTTTSSPHVTRQTTHDNDTSGFAGNSSISAALPMSKSYDTFIEPSNSETGVSDSEQYEHVYQHMPALDWSTATAQAQDGHREYGNDTGTETTSYIYSDGVTGDITTTTGDATLPDTKTVTYDDDKTDTAKSGSSSTEYDTTDTDTKDLTSTTTFDTKDTDTKNLKSETAYGSTDTETKDLSGSTTYNTTDTDTKDLSSRTDFDTSDSRSTSDTRTTDYGATDKLVYDDLTDTVTHTGTDTQAGSTSEEGEVQQQYGDITDSGTDKRTDREQVTGRDEDPATLLLRATQFIERSSAFMWFKEQLDSCFFPGYYTDETCDDTEYGSAFI